jgi:DNA-binding CsgD family transcriptional regulator
VGAETVRSTLVEVTRAGLDPAALFEAATELLRPAVGFSAHCWETLDPVTLLPTSGVTENLPPQSAAAYFDNEYGQDDVNKFEELLRDGVAARTLHQATGGQPERSRRYRELFVPNGLGPELRAVLTDGGECWGAVSLLRRASEDDFPRSAVALLAQVAGAIGSGVRTALLLRAAAHGGEDAPGVVVVDEAGEIVSTTSAAEHWLDLLHDEHHRAGRVRLPVSVEAVLAHLASGPEGAAPRARVQAADGTWLVVHGASLQGGEGGRRVVVIDRVAPRELAAVIVRAYGLSSRERQVAELVLRGLPTKHIARALHLSPHTVTDYLRSLFDKTGVRSRRELAARLLVEHHLPRMFTRTEVGADGWFLDAG